MQKLVSTGNVYNTSGPLQSKELQFCRVFPLVQEQIWNVCYDVTNVACHDTMVTSFQSKHLQKLEKARGQKCLGGALVKSMVITPREL